MVVIYMNEEINIIKITKENGQKVDVEWVLDLNNRCIKKSNIKQ